MAAKRFHFSFERWISKFRKEHSDKGVLGRLVFSDGTFPPQSHSKTEIKNYMKNKGASNDVLKIIDDVWPEFENSGYAKIRSIQSYKTGA